MTNTDRSHDVVAVADGLRRLGYALVATRDTDAQVTVRRTLPAVVTAEARTVVAAMGWSVLSVEPLDGTDSPCARCRERPGVRR